MFLQSVQEKLADLSYIISEQEVETEHIDTETTILRGRLLFVDGSVLDFREFHSPDVHDYRFQFMDADNTLIRRWDSAPHYPEIETHPFHVHTPDTVKSSPEVSLLDVLEQIEDTVLTSMHV